MNQLQQSRFLRMHFVISTCTPSVNYQQTEVDRKTGGCLQNTRASVCIALRRPLIASEGP